MITVDSYIFIPTPPPHIPLPSPCDITPYVDVRIKPAETLYGRHAIAKTILEMLAPAAQRLKRTTFWGHNDLKVRGQYKKTTPPLGRCRLRYGIRRVYRPIFLFLYRSTTTRPAQVRACTPGAYMAAQRMAGRMNDPAYEACNRTRNVFVSPLFRSK